MRFKTSQSPQGVPVPELVCARHVWTVVQVGDEPIGISCSICSENRPVGNRSEPALPVIQLEPGLEYRVQHAGSEWTAAVEHMRIRSDRSSVDIDVEFRVRPPF